MPGPQTRMYEAFGFIERTMPLWKCNMKREQRVNTISPKPIETEKPGFSVEKKQTALARKCKTK